MKTIEELSKLSDEELRVMCARALGWKLVRVDGGPHKGHLLSQLLKPDGDVELQFWWDEKDLESAWIPAWRYVPNYPADLNAALSLLETKDGLIPVHDFNIADFVRCLALLTCAEIDDEPEPCDFFRFLKASARHITIAFIAVKQPHEKEAV